MICEESKRGDSDICNVRVTSLFHCIVIEWTLPVHGRSINAGCRILKQKTGIGRLMEACQSGFATRHYICVNLSHPAAAYIARHGWLSCSAAVSYLFMLTLSVKSVIADSAEPDLRQTDFQVSLREELRLRMIDLKLFVRFLDRRCHDNQSCRFCPHNWVSVTFGRWRQRTVRVVVCGCRRGLVAQPGGLTLSLATRALQSDFGDTCV